MFRGSWNKVFGGVCISPLAASQYPSLWKATSRNWRQPSRGLRSVLPIEAHLVVPAVHHPPRVVDQEWAVGDFLPQARLCRIVFLLRQPGDSGEEDWNDWLLYVEDGLVKTWELSNEDQRSEYNPAMQNLFSPCDRARWPISCTSLLQVASPLRHNPLH